MSAYGVPLISLVTAGFAVYGDWIRVMTGSAAHAAMDRHRRAVVGR